MSISTDTYYSNSLVGVPSVAGEVDVYEVHTLPKFAIGTKFERQDGCVFRYAHFGVAISSLGAMVAPDVSSVNILPTAVTSVLAPSSSYQKEKDPKGVYPGSKGSLYIMATTGGGNTSVSADAYSGGYINIAAGSGAGYTYRIRGNTALNDPTTGYYMLELYDRIQSADLSTSSAFTITSSKYTNLMLAAANTGAGIAAGAVMSTSSTSYPYGWIQTRGITGVKMDGLNVLAGGITLLSIGKPCVLSTGGAVKYASLETNTANCVGIAAFIGTVVTVGSGGNTGLVALNIE